MKASPLASDPAPRPENRGALFSGLFGLLLGVGLLKFGNPVILDRLVETPRGLDEWRAFAWPVRFGQLGLLGVLLVGCLVPRGDWRPKDHSSNQMVGNTEVLTEDRKRSVNSG